MITSTGQFINNNITETGKVLFSGSITEDGESLLHSPLYSIPCTANIVLSGETVSNTGEIFNVNGQLVASGEMKIIQTGLKYEIVGTSKVIISDSAQEIKSHHKIFSFPSTGNIVASTKSEVGFIMPVDGERSTRLQLAVIFKNNIYLQDRDYNLVFIYNPSFVPNAGLVSGYCLSKQDITTRAGLVFGGKGKINTRCSISVAAQMVAAGSEIISVASSYKTYSFIASSGYSELITKRAPLISTSKVVLSGSKSIANSYFNLIGESGFLTSSPVDIISLGRPGYLLKSKAGIVLYNNEASISRSLNLDTASQIVINSLSKQEGFYKAKRPLKLNEYPFINTNGLDEVAVYLGIYRLPGETDGNFYGRIKRLAKIKYGIDYETCTESINEQLGNSLSPIMKIECDLPFTFEINEEFIEIRIFNHDGSVKSYTKVFTNIQNITLNNGNSIYGPLIKLLERIPTDIKVTIIDDDYRNINRELIFKSSNFNINRLNIISNKRSIIKMEHKDGAILSGSIKDDGSSMINRVYDLQSINTYGSYYLDEKQNYLELFAETIQPFSMSFIEYKKTFIIYKSNINIVPINNYIKYGISNNFINLLYLLLDNKVIAS